MNWVDWLLIVFLFMAVLNGLQEGMVRIGIGFIALVAGFILASWFGGIAAGPLIPFLHSEVAASVVGYFLVFCGVLIVVSLIAALIVRMLKLIVLTWMDRLLGGVFGVLRGFVVVAVVMMVVTALAPRWLPRAVNESRFAPYVLSASRTLTSLTPFDIRDGFDRAYKELRRLRE